MSQNSLQFSQSVIQDIMCENPDFLAVTNIADLEYKIRLMRAYQCSREECRQKFFDNKLNSMRAYMLDNSFQASGKDFSLVRAHEQERNRRISQEFTDAKELADLTCVLQDTLLEHEKLQRVPPPAPPPAPARIHQVVNAVPISVSNRVTAIPVQHVGTFPTHVAHALVAAQRSGVPVDVLPRTPAAFTPLEYVGTVPTDVAHALVAAQRSGVPVGIVRNQSCQQPQPTFQQVRPPFVQESSSGMLFFRSAEDVLRPKKFSDHPHSLTCNGCPVCCQNGTGCRRAVHTRCEAHSH